MAYAVLKVAGKSLGLGNKCITSYIYNNSAKLGLIESGSKKPILASLPRDFWGIATYSNIAPWLGRVGPGGDISDLPTRLADLPYVVLSDVDSVSGLIRLDAVNGIPERE